MKTSGSQKIAQRYVSALFDVATQAHALETLEKDLRGIASILKSNTDFRAFLHNPLLSRTAQAAIISNILSHLGVHPITAQFLALLAKQKRLIILTDIIDLFLASASSARGELAATLVYAQPMSDSETATVASTLSTAFNKKVMLTTKKDASLIGGVIVKVGSQQLDGSIAGKLHRLKQALKAA